MILLDKCEPLYKYYATVPYQPIVGVQDQKYPTCVHYDNYLDGIYSCSSD